MTAGFMRSLDLPVLLYNRDQTFSTHTSPEAAGTDGLIDPKTLLLVTSREVLAGRMTENDELRILAMKGLSLPL